MSNRSAAVEADIGEGRGGVRERQGRPSPGSWGLDRPSIYFLPDQLLGHSSQLLGHSSHCPTHAWLGTTTCVIFCWSKVMQDEP